MVFNNDRQYYSTLQNSVDILCSFSNPIKHSIYNKKSNTLINEIQATMWQLFLKLVHIFQKISIPVPQLPPLSHYSTCSNRCQVSELGF